ncbi:MAG TPA: hypothetical protein VJ999_14355 [Candidatus Sulfotelmatobacter sp.]|nr:hypothetical protein [Candidatus Sulfotelmatobacter sp.]
MKRFLIVLLLCVVPASFAWAVPPQASLTPVKATHPPVKRHRAHKATKHRAPKRHRHTV